MMREAKAGHIERIYICRMSQISGQERHLISFFRRLMRYKVNVIATEYALNLKVPAYHMGTIIDEICARKGWERPWFVSESSERHIDPRPSFKTVAAQLRKAAARSAERAVNATRKEER